MELKKYCLRPEMENGEFYQQFNSKFFNGEIYLLDRSKCIDTEQEICIFLYVDNEQKQHVDAMGLETFNKYFAAPDRENN